MPVPITIESRIESLEIEALPSLLSSKTMTSVTAASCMLAVLPKSGAALLPPMAQNAATGISVRPMVVMTMPVTSDGKKRVTRENIGVIRRPISEAAMTAPRMAGMPPLPEIAIIVATPENETPCTSGRRLPKKGRPIVCRMVARPPAKSDAVTSRPTSAEFKPAAWPRIKGTATMPPYMVKTCCRP
ncbi:hypothetical protein D9M72_316970 [compost metagenome]